MKYKTTARTIEYTFETRETYTISRPNKMQRMWCGECGRETAMSAPESAAAITGITTRKIYAEIESGKTHFNEASDGSLMVCLSSVCKTPVGQQFIEGESDRS